MNLKEYFITYLAGNFGYTEFVTWGIYLISPLEVRIALFLLLIAGVFCGLSISRRHAGYRFKLLPIAYLLLVLSIVFVVVSGASSLWIPLIIVGLAAVFQILHDRLKVRQTRWHRSLAVFCLGVSFVFLPGIAVILVDGYRLVELSRNFLIDERAIHFASGPFAGIEYDEETKQLYTFEQDANLLIAYDIAALDTAPHISESIIRDVYDIAYNCVNSELYVYDHGTQEILVFASENLTPIKSVPVKLAEGDDKIGYDRSTDRIVLIAEEDEEDGHSPFIVIDRTTGEILDARGHAMGIQQGLNMFLSPDDSIVYVSTYNRLHGIGYEIVAYDIANLNIRNIKEVPFVMDRFALNSDGTELLVTAPIRGKIVRMDALTLDVIGEIDTDFGVRNVTVDPERNIALSVSIVNNILRTIDISTGETLSKFRLGPWLRSIQVDRNDGIAIVSAIDGLYKVSYASPLSDPLQSSKTCSDRAVVRAEQG